MADSDNNILHPNYRPATEDSTIFIRFAGNTAVPVAVDLHIIDPFQLLAIASYLEHEAKKMLLRLEQEMQKVEPSQIVTPNTIKPTGFN